MKNFSIRLERLLADPIVTQSVNKFVRRYLKQFNHDEAELRSLAMAAILNAAQRYPRKPAEDLRRLAIRSVGNTILNALKAQNRQRRGGGVFHMSVDGCSLDERGRTDYVRKGTAYRGHIGNDEGVVLASEDPNPEQTLLMGEARNLTPTQERLLGEISLSASGMKPEAFFARALKRTGATRADGARLYETLFF